VLLLNYCINYCTCKHKQATSKVTSLLGNVVIDKAPLKTKGAQQGRKMKFDAAIWEELVIKSE